jgi:hypothetical protein
MAEPLWHNSLLSWREHEVAPWQLRGLVHPQVTGWRHLRDVWQTLHQYPGPAPAPLAVQAACQLVLQAVPPPGAGTSWIQPPLPQLGTVLRWRMVGM